MTELAGHSTLSSVLYEGNMASQQQQQQSWKFQDKLSIAIQIAQTVHFLHQSELKTFHRDLKADNILVKAIGEGASSSS